MSICKKLILSLLILSLLCGCSTTASDSAAEAPTTEAPSTEVPTTEVPVTEITIDTSYVIVADGDDTVQQAALCLQATLSNKMNLSSLLITDKEESKKAIILNTDSSLESGAYRFALEGRSLLITASDSQVLLYAVKQLRQAMSDNDNSAKITQELCGSLSGVTEQLPFTFISQNILFKNIEGGNTVNNRAPRFKQLMAEYAPDILALQENSDDWRFHFSRFFSDTYFSTNNNNVTFFFRKDRYELVEKGFFYLSPTPDMRSQFPGDSGPRSCCWAIVTDKSTGKDLFVCDAHLDWNNDTQRALQLEVMIEQLSSYFAQYPTIACGDYNSPPDGPIYARITQLLTDSQVSAQKDLSTVDFTYHGFGEAASTIDYVLHNQLLSPDLYYILSDDYEGYVSDHYGVMTVFQFND